MKEEIFVKGDRIKYVYLHSLNRNSRVKREKKGTFVRYSKGRNGNIKAAVVKIDSNKNTSKVPVTSITKD